MPHYHNLPCDQACEEHILRLLLNKARIDTLTTDYDFTRFTDSIGYRGINTWKRVFGKIRQEGKFSPTTLNIIATYLGFSDWDDLLHNLQTPTAPSTLRSDYNEGISLLQQPDEEMTFNCGQRLEIVYNNHRTLRLQYLRGNQYLVIDSQSRQILRNDLLVIEHLQEGGRLIATSTIRERHNYGQYQSAGTIVSIQRLYDPNDDYHENR